MVLSGARVQYKGVGTINGGGDYGFLLTATDGRLVAAGEPDRLRIQVWDRATGATVYDNQPGAAEGEPPLRGRHAPGRRQHRHP
jgi:hypothetical protein